MNKKPPSATYGHVLQMIRLTERQQPVFLFTVFNGYYVVVGAHCSGNDVEVYRAQDRVLRPVTGVEVL